MARIDRLAESNRNLLKIASVIGRSFFYRVLNSVAVDISDIDNKLSYLKGVQLIIEQKRMDEIEYLFKHALAQQVTYDSILKMNRKNLHLRVANSIEEIFSDRLNEFYGLLSYHFSNGGDLDKSEKYMIKAGKEALKTSASSEALYYYQNALELYLNKNKVKIDRIKIANLQEDIAFAFLNKGIFSEAMAYYDKALDNRGIRVNKSTTQNFIKLLFNIVLIAARLYLPRIRKYKAITEDDALELYSFRHRTFALTYVDIERLFYENIEYVSKILKYDISNSQTGFDMISGAGGLFSISGISFALSRKLLNHSIIPSPSFQP